MTTSSTSCSCLSLSNVSLSATGTATTNLLSYCFPSQFITANIVAPVAMPSSTKIIGRLYNQALFKPAKINGSLF